MILTAVLTSWQKRTEVRWRPAQDTSL